MNAALVIEPAREEHLPQIASLAEIVWRANYPGIISSEQIEYMLARMYDLDVLRRELTSGIRFDRALVDKVLRGFSSYGPSGVVDEVKLHKLYVHPEWQRCGIGRALLDRCEAKARASGATSLVLNVNKRNAHAVAAYQKHGFTIRDSVLVDIGGGFVMDDYVMARNIHEPAFHARTSQA